jgi:reverse gyrase
VQDISKAEPIGTVEKNELEYRTSHTPLKYSFGQMLLTCLPRCIGKSRYRKIIEKGTNKIDQSMDIRTLIETNRTVKILKRVLLNYRQSVMCDLTRLSYVGSETSEDDIRDIIVN